MAIVVSKCHGFFLPPVGRFLLVCASGTSENFSSELHKTTLQGFGKLRENLVVSGGSANNNLCRSCQRPYR